MATARVSLVGRAAVLWDDEDPNGVTVQIAPAGFEYAAVAYPTCADWFARRGGRELCRGSHAEAGRQALLAVEGRLAVP